MEKFIKEKLREIEKQENINRIQHCLNGFRHQSYTWKQNLLSSSEE